jgi:hypothetical protein
MFSGRRDAKTPRAENPGDGAPDSEASADDGDDGQATPTESGSFSWSNKVRE